MLKSITNFLDEESLKVNIIMKDGVEFLGVDLVGDTNEHVVGFAWDVGIRMVNRADVKYIDWYLEESGE